MLLQRRAEFCSAVVPGRRKVTCRVPPHLRVSLLLPFMSSVTSVVVRAFLYIPGTLYILFTLYVQTTVHINTGLFTHDHSSALSSLSAVKPSSLPQFSHLPHAWFPWPIDARDRYGFGCKPRLTSLTASSPDVPLTIQY